jgi:hypothetical protein
MNKKIICIGIVSLFLILGLSTITITAEQICKTADNTPPILTDGKVSPKIGNEDDTFKFEVMYEDAEGDWPQVAKLFIDDEQKFFTANLYDDYEYLDEGLFRIFWYINGKDIGKGYHHKFKFYVSNSYSDAWNPTPEEEAYSDWYYDGFVVSRTRNTNKLLFNDILQNFRFSSIFSKFFSF